MAKHSKNATASSVFTYHERRKLKYGTQKQRVNGDYMLDFDACALCLHSAVDPLVCQKGHAFCKACVYEHLLTQKKHIKKQMKLYKQHQKREGDEEQREEDQRKRVAMEAFAKLESSILPSNKTRMFEAKRVEDSTQVPKGYKAIKTETGTMFVVDLEQVKSDKSLPCFWIPHLTPGTNDDSVAKPNSNTMCPSGGHILRLKQLKPVHFTTTKEKEEEKQTSKREAGRNVCPSCLKTLTNATRLSVIRTCGHVVCRPCVLEVVRKAKACVACSEPCTVDDVVELQSGGTSFASGGAHVAKSQVTPSFQG